LAVVVRGSAAHRDRTAVAQRAGGRAAAAAGASLFYVADAPPPPGADSGVANVTVLGDALAREANYTGAQHRSLRGLLHAVGAAPAARWFWLVDDDTYFDVGQAAALARRVDHRVPAVLGHLFRGMLRFAGVAPMCSVSGGAGMLLSAAAARALAGALYTPTCPFYGLNDLTLSRCAYRLGIPLVHHDGFQPEFDGYIVHDLRGRHSLAELGGYLTAHRLVPTYFLTEALAALDAYVRPPGAAGTPFEWWEGRGVGRRRRRLLRRRQRRLAALRRRRRRRPQQHRP
jgi:hypothetical protein